MKPFNPNERQILTEEQLQKAYEQLENLYKAIEIAVYTYHSNYWPLRNQLNLEDPNVQQLLLDQSLPVIQTSIPPDIRQLYEEVRTIEQFVKEVFEVYVENVKRFTEYLAQPNYIPFTVANEFFSRLNLAQGIDIAQAVYEYQMLSTTVVYAYMEQIKNLEVFATPALLHIRNTYAQYVGILVELLPYLANVRRLILDTIDKVGTYETTAKLLKLLYGLHLNLLKGWLIKDIGSLNLFFAKYDINDPEEVHRKWLDVKQGKIASDVVMFDKEQTEQILENDPLWKSDIKALRIGIYRTPYVLVDITTVDRFNQAVIDYLVALIMLYWHVHEQAKQNIGFEQIHGQLMQWLDNLRDRELTTYYKTLLNTLLNVGVTADTLAMWYDYMNIQTTITLFGDKITLSVAQLIIVSLLSLNMLLSDTFNLLQEILQTDLGDTGFYALFTLLANGDYLASGHLKHIQHRSRQILKYLISGQKVHKQTVSALKYILEQITDTRRYEELIHKYISTFLQADLSSRIRETVKLFAQTLILALPFIDPNFITLPLVDFLYSYIGANVLSLNNIVADLIIRTFELPFRPLLYGETTATYQVFSTTDYVAIDNLVQLIVGSLAIPRDTLYGIKCLMYCANIYKTRDEIDILAQTLVQAAVSVDGKVEQADTLEQMRITKTPLCAEQLSTHLRCLTYIQPSEVGIVCLPRTAEELQVFYKSLLQNLLISYSTMERT